MIFKESIEGLVSIVMPNFNGARYIQESITSVLDQTFKNWELLIIDDCSTDNSIEVIEDLISHDQIVLYKNEYNSGTVASRNTGIKAAKGQYIAFLDSDDIWHPDKLQIQVNYMKKHNEFATCTAYDIVDAFGVLKASHFVPTSISYVDLLYKCDIGCSTVILDITKLGKAYFDKNSPKAREDYVLWLKITKDGSIFRGINTKLMYYRKHSLGISANKLKVTRGILQVYKQENIPFVKSMWYLFFYSFNGFIKHYVKLIKFRQ